MPRLVFSADIAAPLEEVWAFYDSVETLPKITPPSTKVTLIGAPGKLEAGSRFTLVVRQPPVFVPLRWETIITEYAPPHRFVDEQGKGPFASWHHEHTFEATNPDQTRITDTITYTPPFWFLGRIADALFIRRQLTAMFAYRYEQTRKALEGSKQ
jgi:ligand-binding SRPBCC domain-containing protein